MNSISFTSNYVEQSRIRETARLLHQSCASTSICQRLSQSERADRSAASTEIYEDWPGAWGDQTGDLYLNPTTYLANVPEKVWRYELGGYPVIKKWLGYRQSKKRSGMPLTQDELAHLRGIVQRLAALHILHSELDALYERIGLDVFTAEYLGIR